MTSNTSATECVHGIAMNAPCQACATWGTAKVASPFTGRKQITITVVNGGPGVGWVLGMHDPVTAEVWNSTVELDPGLTQANGLAKAAFEFFNEKLGGKHRIGAFTRVEDEDLATDFPTGYAAFQVDTY